MIGRKTKERPFGATDERENVILSGTKCSFFDHLATCCLSGHDPRTGGRISICMLLTAFLSCCSDYAAKMEDDFEEWKTAQQQSQNDDVEAVDPSTVTTGEMTDPRDNQTYKIVTIGSQTWMAQNLNYETENSFCYNDDPANCDTYGRLYTWAAATTACPTGWHLPSNAEFETLFSAVGGSSTAGKMLKSTSGWNNSGNGTDAYAFSALPAGFRYYSGDRGYYTGEGYDAYFWSSTEYNINSTYYMSLFYDTDGGAYLGDNYENYGFPVRCLKD